MVNVNLIQNTVRSGYYFLRRPRCQSVPHVEQNQVGSKANCHAEKDIKSRLQRSFHFQSYIGHLTESHFQDPCCQ